MTPILNSYDKDDIIEQLESEINKLVDDQELAEDCMEQLWEYIDNGATKKDAYNMLTIIVAKELKG